MFEELNEASHIVAGMGVTLDYALGIVRAAHAESEPSEDEATSTDNVVYGLDFGGGR